MGPVDSVRWRCTFPPPGTAVSCAVSGGPDSLALLVLAADAGLDVTAIHVDHGLRPDSACDAEVVQSAAERFGAAFRAERVEVAPGGDLEARARRARHGVLPAGTLFGHTADDQAETVLLALLRGTGLDGLAGMRAEQHPILHLRRVETAAVCAFAGLDPVQDPTNADPRFRRNRIRHEVLPLLDRVAERDVSALLARMAVVVGDDVGLLDSLSSEIDPTDATQLAAAPVPLARRAVRTWLRQLDADGYPPDLASVERVLAVARGDAVAAQVTGGLEVRRSRQRLDVRRLATDH
ncbi:MAG: tRNA lysidine(34) synthetase TilS [Acidimicrobiales bacterium]|nr:tRNA lysidine(34) synthetase TilS [Acidimicrobiales bacterium]